MAFYRQPLLLSRHLRVGAGLLGQELPRTGLFWRCLSTLNKKMASNFDIVSKTGNIRLIDADGTNRGLQNLEKSIQLAKKQGKDLVQVAESPGDTEDEVIPVCKILELEKVLFEQKKKNAEKKAKAKVNERQAQMKEIKLGTSIGENDVKFKLAKASEFLSKGYSLRFTVVFRRSLQLAPKDREARAFELLEIARKELLNCGRELENQRKTMPGSIRAVFVPTST